MYPVVPLLVSSCQDELQGLGQRGPALGMCSQAQKISGYADLSPGCCAQQLIIEAGICARCVSQPGATDTALHKGLHSLRAGPLCTAVQCLWPACELAVGMEPKMWWEVSLNP